MSHKSNIFPVGGTNNFEFVCTRYNDDTDEYNTQNIESATEVTVYIVTRNQPSVTLASHICSPIYYFADWANGVVTGEFDNSVTSTIQHLGFANLVLKAMIAGEPEYFYSDDKAILLVSAP